MKLVLFFTLVSLNLFSQSIFHTNKISKTQLRDSLVQIISHYKAEIGLAVIEIESGDTLSVNNDKRYAMQSVYKFPIALAILNEVDKGKLSLKERLFLKKELLSFFTNSKLKSQNPNINQLSIDSLIMYMIAYSDNLATDILFERIGGTGRVHNYIQNQGFNKILIKNAEIEIGSNPTAMFSNSSSPMEMSKLLKAFYDRKIVADSSVNYLLNYMINDSTPHNRIMGNLPSGTIVAHKTGTGMKGEQVAACNDVGIIYLPNGKHIALSVFVMNSKETYEKTAEIIAILSKKIYDFYADYKK